MKKLKRFRSLSKNITISLYKLLSWDEMYVLPYQYEKLDISNDDMSEVKPGI